MTDDYTPGQPPQIPTAVKAWVGFIIGVIMSNAAVVTTALADGAWSTADTWAVAIAVIGSIGVGLGVYAAPRYSAAR